MPCRVASGPMSVAASRGSPTCTAAACAQNAATNASWHVGVHDEPLGRDAALPGVLAAGPGGDRGCPLDVGRGHHHERVAAAELEHGLLERRAREPRRPTGPLPRCRSGSRPRPADRRPPRPRRTTRRAGSGTRPRGSRRRRNTSCRASASGGTFEACLSSTTLPAIERRRGEPDRPARTGSSTASRRAPGRAAPSGYMARRRIPRRVAGSSARIAPHSRHRTCPAAHFAISALAALIVLPISGSPARRSPRFPIRGFRRAACIHWARWAKLVCRY